jgi:spore maturation protein SpmA
MTDTFVKALVILAPLLLLLALWLFLLRAMRKGNFGYQKTVVEPMRKVLQEDVVPEIRAIRESIDALTSDLKARNEKSGL